MGWDWIGKLTRQRHIDMHEANVVPMRAGSFSREKALYGAMIVACATCHADPRRVTVG